MGSSSDGFKTRLLIQAPERVGGTSIGLNWPEFSDEHETAFTGPRLEDRIVGSRQLEHRPDQNEFFLLL